MVIGYRSAEFIPVWNPPSFAKHINNPADVGFVLLAGLCPATNGASLRGKMRHPMLIGFSIVWAVAHLLVNGDLVDPWSCLGACWHGRSARSFSSTAQSLIGYAPSRAPPSKDVLLVAITVVTWCDRQLPSIFWLGVWPFAEKERA